MPSRPLQFARFLGLLLVAGCVSLPALAQRGGAQGKTKAEKQAERQAARQAEKQAEKQNRLANPEPGKVANPGAGPNSSAREAQPQPNQGRALMGLPPRWTDRLRSMTPQQQERFLQNNERFKNLPPERQEQIRRQLQQWNRLTPEQQQQMRNREQLWERMTPEQQRYVRQDLLPRWQQLPPGRRLAIQRHLAALSGLSEADRSARLHDPDFLRGLSPDEQKMLRELSNLRVGAPQPPDENPF